MAVPEADNTRAFPMPDNYRQCDTEHMRNYPGCYEECGHDKCVADEQTSREGQDGGT